MKKLYETLNKKNLTPNEFYVLWCVEHKKECTLVDYEAILEDLKSRKLALDIGVKKNLSELMERMDLMYSDNPAKRMSLTTSYSEKVKEYQDLWPKGKIGVNNRRLWSSAKNLEAAFKWFFNNHTYDWETVLRATKKYLDQEEDAGYPFTRTSKYFIRKADPGMSSQSDLTDYCEIILEGEDEEKVKHFV